MQQTQALTSIVDQHIEFWVVLLDLLSELADLLQISKISSVRADFTRSAGFLHLLLGLLHPLWVSAASPQCVSRISRYTCSSLPAALLWKVAGNLAGNAGSSRHMLSLQQ